MGLAMASVLEVSNGARMRITSAQTPSDASAIALAPSHGCT